VSQVARAPKSATAPSRAADGVWSAQGKLLVGIACVAFVALFFRFFIRQGQFSIEFIDDWGHAFVIPIISGYLVWRERAKLLACELVPFWPGVLPLVLGVVTYFFFVLGVSNHMLQGASMLLALSGLVMLTCGLGVLRLTFLPIAFLVFGITISEQVMIKATFPLQLLATQGAWLLLKLVSLPGNWYFVEADGNMLTMFYKGRQIPLNVAEACSGMRMVIAFVALAGAVALLSVHEWWKRAAVVMLAVPVALFMNIIRVCVLALASLYDNNLASGNVHMLIGTLLLIPGLGLFLAAVWALDRVVKPDGKPDAKPDGKPDGIPAASPAASGGGVA
jgi:exosortase